MSSLGLPDDELRRLRHDVRTPMTIITGFAEVLAADRPISDDDRRDYARRILDAGVELRGMIDTILDDPPR
ncbi:MAG: His Kinase (phospho-acceptor) domain [Solirubrobacteraceae bacterium]|nr:His Kinase (phospho-acceptor) domain [Solirubrobacteraceae bacterium]